MKLDYFVVTRYIKIVFPYIPYHEFTVVLTTLQVKQHMNIISSLNLQKFMTNVLNVTILSLGEVMGSLLLLVRSNRKGLYTPYNYLAVSLSLLSRNLTRMERTQDCLSPFPLFKLCTFPQTFVPIHKLRLGLPWRLWSIPTPR